MPEATDYVLLITSDTLGQGSKELGKKLMNSYLHCLSQSETLPSHILFMNYGVNLVLDNSDVLEELDTLQNNGVQLKACGTCLDYYEVKERVAVGQIGNMYTSVDLMNTAAKVITIG